MTIYYFTSTGNSLSVAKSIAGRTGDDLVSIPQTDEEPSLEFNGELFGIVSPIYSWGLPKMVRRFVEKTRWQAEYSFAVGTYGNAPGAAMRNLQRLAAKQGKRIDYAESILMVDNYLPLFDVQDQLAKVPEKGIEQNLERIVADIAGRKSLQAKAPIHWRALTAILKRLEPLTMNDKPDDSYIVGDNCNGCGTCEKLCPAGNIDVMDGLPWFGERCEWCLCCLHLCPRNSLHLKSEKSSARFRNPDVTLAEIIAANNRKKTVPPTD